MARIQRVGRLLRLLQDTDDHLNVTGKACKLKEELLFNWRIKQ